MDRTDGFQPRLEDLEGETERGSRPRPPSSPAAPLWFLFFWISCFSRCLLSAVTACVCTFFIRPCLFDARSLWVTSSCFHVCCKKTLPDVLSTCTIAVVSIQRSLPVYLFLFSISLFIFLHMMLFNFTVF